MTVAIAHFPMSFPRDGVLFGWSDEFNGLFADYGEFVTQTAMSLNADTVLLRGYSGCASRTEAWHVGYTNGARDITSSVYCSAELPDSFVGPRRDMVARIKRAGLRVMVHDGPATNRHRALVSARMLADDGVDWAAIDSTGRNTSSVVALQLEAIDAFGVTPFTEPDGNAELPCLANAENFVIPAIARGDDVSQYVAWLNNPSDETRLDPGSVIGPCIQAGVMGVAVPHRILTKMRGGR